MRGRLSAIGRPKIVWTLAAFAFLVRLAAIYLFRKYSFSAPGFGSGFEIGNISRSLVAGHGFSSPFGGNTGPTAWIAPLYPSLQAVVFKLFGIETVASGVTMRILNAAAAPAMCILIDRIATRVWNERIAIAAVTSWVLFPDSIWYDSVVVWDTMLSTALLLLLIDCVVVRRECGAKRHVALGLLGGLIALLNPSLLSAVAVCFIWQWLRLPRDRFKSVVLTGLVMAATVTPWAIRNYRVFGRPVFIRSNFGHELYKGNRPGATGQNDWSLNPYNNPEELKRYQALGEMGYVADDKSRAIKSIKADPAKFFRLVRRRIDAFWNGPLDLGGMFTDDPQYLWTKQIWFSSLSLMGLLGILVALLRREPFAGLFAGIVFVYPIIYYVTFPNVRYRLPVEPILLLYTLRLITTLSVRRRSNQPVESLADAEVSPQPITMTLGL